MTMFRLAVPLCATLALAGCSEESGPTGFVDLGADPIVDPGPGMIDAQTQVIYLRFTAEFPLALEEYGLAPLEDEVKQAARMHLLADLAGYNFAVLLDAGELALAGADQTITIEVRNADPNGIGLFENDNALPGKDVDNNIRDELVGGFNEHFDGNGLPGGGGIFIGAQLGGFNDEAMHPRFREAFSPTAAPLGGSPILEFPGSPNDELVEQMGSALGAMIAASAATLAGGLVGLPADTGAVVNEGDNGCFMDARGVRSFPERARIDGASESFCADAASYLNTIVPGA